ncbi:MAG: diguanylate cyclase [Bacillota bacterium]
MSPAFNTAKRDLLRRASELFAGEFRYSPEGDEDHTGPQLLRTLGYENVRSLDPSTWRHHLHPLDLAQIEEYFARGGGEGADMPFLHSVRYRRVDGGEVTAVLLASVEPGTRGKVVVGKNYLTIPAPDEGSVRQELVGKAFDLVPLGVFLVDREGNILRANPEARRIWGEIPLVGPTDYGLFRARRYPSGEPVERDDWAVLKTLRDGKPILDDVLEIETADGGRKVILNTTTPLVDSRGEVTGAIVINRDVTEHRRILSALERTETFRHAITMAVPDLLVLFDSQGNYLDILTENESVLPISRDRLVTSNVAEVLPAHIAQRTRALITSALESGESQRTEYPLVTPAGNRFYEAQMVPITPTGEVVTSIRDITDRKRAALDLQEREEELEAIYNNAPLMIVLLDKKRQIVKANAFTQRTTGLSEEDILGRRVGEVLGCPQSPSTPGESAREEICQRCGLRSLLLDTLHTGRSHHQIEVTLETFSGDELASRHLLLSTNRIMFGDEPRIMVSIMDVTQRREYEQRLEYLSHYDTLTGLHNRARYEEELSKMDGSDRDLVGTISLDLDGLKLINDTMGHERGDQMLTTTAELIRSSVRTEDFAARVGGDEFIVLLPGADNDSTEMVANRIERAIVDYNRTEPPVPLSISVGTATRRDSSRPLAEITVEAEDRMYHNKLQQSASARSHIIDALLATLAEKDYITEGHARRLDDLTRRVGMDMGLSSQALSNLSLLSRVHDLGKVSTPDRILNKRDPLTPEEWEIMRQHPEVGYRIASSSRDLAHIADLILKHHERWDGTGYPLGNTGEEIPIECRILAVVDAYDAMTNDRSYRPAMSHEEAEEELLRNVGTQFDPRVVEVFTCLVREERGQGEE